MSADVSASWAHATGLVAAATTTALIDAPPGHTAADRTRRGVDDLAAAHPWLTALADPAAVDLTTAPDPDSLAAVEAAWATSPPVDTPNRPTGYALGDAWQALSVEARKGRALCQTPRYVTDLMLDMALDPALAETGPDTRAVDPACGTGHILVEALLRCWANPWGTPPGSRSPTRPRIAFEEAVAMVAGVDLDPYAVLLARYRVLTLLARVDGRRGPLRDTPRDVPARIVHADSLLADPADHPELTRGAHDVVVMNPPYIVAPKATVNQIRAAYPKVCHAQYSLALPFTALATDLTRPGGRIVQLTTNAWMRREYGARFVTWLSGLDVTWVIDTSGCYIPGHGTPTVILMHRNRAPVAGTVHAVLGIRGEPGRPTDPARGVVWSAIAAAVRERLAGDAHAPAGEPRPEPATLGQQALFPALGAR